MNFRTHGAHSVAADDSASGKREEGVGDVQDERGGEGGDGEGAHGADARAVHARPGTHSSCPALHLTSLSFCSM